ncbi:hypothetical protein EV361DRAFT_809938 [Lentinula raphanica]|nr:hypothetical protein EV361DRAFT_809938 [Lentinula raphanica]
METNLSISSDFASYVYRTQELRDNTLDQAQLETRCPLDNGRHDCTSTPARYTVNRLDKFPLELLTEVLLQLDIPSLTRFRAVNHRTMELVNSIRQYAAIIQHCPNIIRAIVSIQADGFDCATLYNTLCTTRCSTCNHFGDHLYLIDCRRACYFCFIYRPEYFPLTSREAYRLFTSNAKPQSRAESSRKRRELTKLPSILSLPGRYCCAYNNDGTEGKLQQRRLRLYDRQAVVQSLVADALPRSDRVTGEPKRHMAIISAPVLLDGGRQVDHGFFCVPCRDEGDMDFRIKYTTEEISRHFASFGQVVKSPAPGRYMHVTKD